MFRHVQHLIQRCLQLYMSEKEVVGTLLQHAKIEPCFTELNIKQWEYISYCLSQLSFTDKGMKKLMDSFKTYEHVLSDDSVMDHFKNIINKAKKFAKPELKACIEESEEKINKFHIEKKELEIITKNAEVHRQKVQILENIRVSKEDGEECTRSEISGDGVVSDPSMEVIA